jgi:hypothetical protein
MLGYLLARAGIDVVVGEKHTDFLRDFHGDTIHPSTLKLMHEPSTIRTMTRRSSGGGRRPRPCCRGVNEGPPRPRRCDNSPGIASTFPSELPPAA